MSGLNYTLTSIWSRRRQLWLWVLALLLLTMLLWASLAPVSQIDSSVAPHSPALIAGDPDNTYGCGTAGWTGGLTYCPPTPTPTPPSIDGPSPNPPFVP